MPHARHLHGHRVGVARVVEGRRAVTDSEPPKKSAIVGWVTRVPDPVALLILGVIAKFVWSTNDRLTRIETYLRLGNGAETQEAAAFAGRLRMGPTIDWLWNHRYESMHWLLDGYALLCAYVAATPSMKDDAWLARVMQRVSLLRPKNIPGRLSMPGAREWAKRPSLPPVLLMLCLGIALSGCAKREALRGVVEFVRSSSCAVCDKLGGEAGCPEHEP
jgi:hypothetical protein